MISTSPAPAAVRRGLFFFINLLLAPAFIRLQLFDHILSRQSQETLLAGMAEALGLMPALDYLYIRAGERIPSTSE